MQTLHCKASLIVNSKNRLKSESKLSFFVKKYLFRLSNSGNYQKSRKGQKVSRSFNVFQVFLVILSDIKLSVRGVVTLLQTG